MSGISTGGEPNSFGTPSQIAVTRALAEFHARRPVQIAGKGGSILALPVDGMDKSALAAFRRLCAPAAPCLVVTAERARAIGIETVCAVAIELDRHADPAAIMALAAGSQSAHSGAV